MPTPSGSRGPLPGAGARRWIPRRIRTEVRKTRRRKVAVVYGLINRAIEELVRSSGDPGLWDTVRARADVAIDYFEGMEVYDDEITSRLVTAAAHELGTTSDELLERFGRYWIVYTGAEGWGPILDGHGNSVLEVLENLDDLHLRLSSSMPHLRAPRFEVVGSSPDRIDVRYRSERDGLASMVTGMLRGLAERFGEQWHIAHVGLRATDGYDSYLLSARQPAAAAAPTHATPGDWAAEIASP